MAEQTSDRSDRSVSSAKPPGGDLVLQWVVASVAGWLVGWIVAWIGALSVGWIVAWAGVGIGTGVGVAQWLVLKERVARAGWWVVASAVGGVVGGVASVGLILGAYVGAGQIMGDVVAVILGWVLVGVGIGAAQWLVLRGHVARAGWWVLASVVGWIVGRIAAWFAVGFVAVDVIVGQVVGQVAYGVVYGVITGLLLVQLLRQRAGEANSAMTGDLPQHRPREIEQGRWYGSRDRALPQHSPREFEHLIVRLYERMGYEVQLTQQSRDGGVDLYARRDHGGGQEALAVECKHYQSSTVGVAPVRALYGVLTAQPELTQAVLITSGTVSRDAQEFAAGKRIALIDGAQLAKLLAKYDV